jgi:hypothetical protein
MVALAQMRGAPEQSASQRHHRTSTARLGVSPGQSRPIGEPPLIDLARAHAHAQWARAQLDSQPDTLFSDANHIADT